MLTHAAPALPSPRAMLSDFGSSILSTNWQRQRSGHTGTMEVSVGVTSTRPSMLALTPNMTYLLTHLLISTSSPFSTSRPKR